MRTMNCIVKWKDEDEFSIYGKWSSCIECFVYYIETLGFTFERVLSATLYVFNSEDLCDLN